MTVEFSIPSYAKINRTLRVLGRRSDGYHEVFTVFQTVSLYDVLHFDESDDLELTCDDPEVPTDERNLISKAASELRRRSGVGVGAAIHLEKRIPSPGGLGGGSSNAAAALFGLNRLWRSAATRDDIVEILSGIGSDAPFFAFGGTAIGRARGDIIEPVDDMPPQMLLIVTPSIHVHTADAFRDLGAETLTSDELGRILSVCRTEYEVGLGPGSDLKNDFERTVFAAHPEIEKVKTALIDLGATAAALSGSGASVFAIFDKQETRQAAEKALEYNSTWRKFAVSTISRGQYREALGIEG
jgi:4-diphosphocytidyl-2-C-methyl-D-erythritol kinase